MVANPSGRRAKRSRDDILFAAARAFGRNGLARTTMAEIAEEVGYTVPSLYAHFGGKDDIIDALAEKLASEVLAVFNEEPPAGLSTAQRLELLLRRLFALTEHRREILSVFSTLPMGGKAGSALMRDGHEAMRVRLARWFREHEDLGPQAQRVSDDLAVALLGICEAFVKRWMREKSPKLLVHQASLVADLFVHGARSRMGRPS
jgi:AcrR family transcriptional regulator